MNIANVGNAPVTAPSAAGPANSEVPENTTSETALTQETIQEAGSANREDAYIPSQVNRLNNVLYDVSDVSRNGISRLSAHAQEGRVTASGEKIGPKVVEILLPTGRKSLSIYRKLLENE